MEGKLFVNNIFNLNQNITKQNALEPKFFSIDEAFWINSLKSKIDYLKPPDYIYVCLAHQEKGILLTEDNQQYKVAKKANIESYKINEFIKTYQ